MKGAGVGAQGYRARFNGCLYKIGAPILGVWEELGELAGGRGIVLWGPGVRRSTQEGAWQGVNHVRGRRPA